MLIQVEHVTHTYAPNSPLARTALSDVSLKIPPGQRVGVIGATGSGKSTLVQLVAGLFRPTAGQVLLDGVHAHRGTRSARARRRRIGVAFQYPEDQIFESTVFREVAFGLRQRARTTHTRLPADQLRARVHGVLAQLGLNLAVIELRSPLTLSGGEMRRVALAGVLCTQPEVLILDEPTAGLDPQGRRTLLSSIQSWSSDLSGLTLIVISHNLDHLNQLADRIVVLARGRVVADGSTRDILTDLDLLHAAGLDAAPPVKLLHALRRAGWSIQTGIASSQAAVAEIARAWRLREGQ
jgi:energy-coupling factor transport system ATP-binding protein